MEAAGLVLGAVAIVKPICATIDEALTDYSSFGKDAERLRLRFAVQRTRLDSMERVLFEDKKFLPAMPGRLIEHLPERVCNDILALLRQLYGLLIEFSAVRSHYKMQEPVDSLDVGSLASLTADDRIKNLTLQKKESDKAQQKAVGWARKMLWVVFDKSSMEKLVSEFEAWAERTQTLLEAAWWPLSFFETVERMRKLEEDNDAKTVGLLRGIGVRKLLITPPSTITAHSQAKEALPKDFTATSQLADFEIGTLKDSDGYYLVEYKGYELDGRSSVSDVVIRQRVLQLVALLQEAPLSDPALRVMQCTHFFEETPKSRFGLIYRLPTVNGVLSQPVTLASVLDAKYKGGRPSLSSRIRLAHKIVSSLQRLHIYSWVHKSLRPENILLFPDDDGQSALWAAFDDPKLVGFEFSRRESDFSNQFGEEEINRNIYRHPTRWRQPINRFEKIHDIYALGVILLEIGLWSRADQIDNGALVTSGMANNPLAVKARLLKHADQRLGFYAGDTIQKITVACLTGKWDKLSIVETFSEVVDTLGGIASSF